MLGYRDVQVLRRADADEVEFITIMTFDTLEAIKQFVGEDISVAHVPAKAREILSHWDERSEHYELREQLSY